MTTGRYHRDAYGLPAVRLPSGPVTLRASGHAQREAMADRYGAIDLPAYLNLRPGDIFEVRMEDGYVARTVSRHRYDDTRDIVLVLAPPTFPGGEYIIVTAWVNLSNDQHSTLDVRRYDKP